MSHAAENPCVIAGSVICQLRKSGQITEALFIRCQEYQAPSEEQQAVI